VFSLFACGKGLGSGFRVQGLVRVQGSGFRV
jgi:hypothetical protein